MIKKLLATIGLILTLSGMAAPLASAVVELDPNLHPEYAPVVVLGKTANEADYGNYFLQLIAGGLLYLAGPVAILFIAVAGLQYVSSHGAQTKLEAAKNTLQWAVVGLVVIILAYAIVRVVISLILNTGV